MKNLFIAIFIILGIVGLGIWYQYGRDENITEKIYVAAEEDGVVNVIDSVTRQVIRTVDLSVAHEGGLVKFFPHNVQVAPDGKSVWITANAGKHEHGGRSQGLINEAYAHGEADEGGAEPDQIIVLDPGKRDRIIARIEADMGAQLAHVVVAPDGAFAYATAQKRAVLYKIDARAKEIISEIAFAKDSQPHGLRLSPDGKRAYTAVLAGKALAVIDLENNMTVLKPLEGQGVQAGVTPDGKYAAISLYDAKSLALYDITADKITYIALPESSQGPIQMYPTPDSKFFYLADQGYFFERPVSESVYKIDIEKRAVAKEIKAGKAPHGVVVSKDGKFVFVTNLLDNNISVIDAVTDAEIAKIHVGGKPNGISIWHKNLGGTP